jgi:hypothetical protein
MNLAKGKIWLVLVREWAKLSALSIRCNTFERRESEYITPGKPIQTIGVGRAQYREIA